MIYRFLRRLKYTNIFYFSTLVYLKQKLSGQCFNPGRSGVILNCGLPRSGSTLLNLMIKEILVKGIISEDNYVDNHKQLSERLSSYKHSSLIKTHAFFPNVGSLIKRGQVIAFMTHRDIRDVVVSLCQKGWVDNIFEFVKSKDLKNMAYTSIAYSQITGMNIISFDEMMSDPKSIISFLASKLNISLTNDEIDQIAKNVSKEEIMNKVKKLHEEDDSAGKFDKSSGLHSNHISDAKSGKWKYTLTPEEVNIVSGECFEYLELFGYSNENV